MELPIQLTPISIPTIRHVPIIPCDIESIFAKYKLGTAHSNAPFKLFESTCSTSGDDDSDSQKNFRKMRGPYRKYTFEEKMEAVNRVLTKLIQIIAGEDVKIVSREFCIPRRNLLRWKKNGCQRKEGGGRPTDSDMELVLYEKIKNRELTDEKQIRKFAVQYSKLTTFKASKGWFVKFCNRFNITLSSFCPADAPTCVSISTN